MLSGYGIENTFLSYCNLPLATPFIPYYDHGWALNDIQARASTLENPSNTHLAWNSRVKKNIEAVSNKKVYVKSSPFKLFKEMNCIKKNTQKKSLYFVSHATDKVHTNITPTIIHSFLQTLPNHFKPIDICLHWFDYKNYFRAYKDFGYDVKSAGPIFNNNFIERFYKIISTYEFCLSNILGSYVLYCIDLGIPFSRVGPVPEYSNVGNDKNVPKKYNVHNFNFAKKILNEFDGLHYSICSSQKDIIDNELDYQNRLSKENLRSIILRELMKSPLSFNGMNSLSRSLLKPIIFKFKNFLDRNNIKKFHKSINAQ